MSFKVRRFLLIMLLFCCTCLVVLGFMGSLGSIFGAFGWLCAGLMTLAELVNLHVEKNFLDMLKTLLEENNLKEKENDE